MIKFNLRPAGLISVLIFGLVSCAPHEEQGRDIFRPPSPKIIVTGQNSELKEWNKSTEKNLSLWDAIDASESQAHHAAIETTCRHGNRNLSHSVNVSVKAPIYIFQTIPHELLAADFAEVATNCTWVVRLFNGAGSQCIFNMANATIQPGEESTELRMEREGQVLGANTKLNFADLDHVILRAPVAGQVRLLCEDGDSEAAQISNPIPLSTFDVNKMREKGSRLSHSLQKCRAALIKDNVVMATSPRLQLLFGEPMQITAVDLPNRTYGWDPGRVQSVIFGVELLTATLQVTNSSDFPRTFRLSKAALPANSLLILNTPDRSTWPTNEFTFLHLSAMPGPNSAVTESADFYEIRVGGRGQFTIQSKYRTLTEQPKQCLSAQVAGVYIGFPVPGTLIELSQKGEEIMKQEFNLGPPLIINGDGPKSLFENIEFKPNAKCIWRG